MTSHVTEFSSGFPEARWGGAEESVVMVMHEMLRYLLKYGVPAWSIDGASRGMYCIPSLYKASTVDIVRIE